MSFMWRWICLFSCIWKAVMPASTSGATQPMTMNSVLQPFGSSKMVLVTCTTNRSRTLPLEMTLKDIDSKDAFISKEFRYASGDTQCEGGSALSSCNQTGPFHTLSLFVDIVHGAKKCFQCTLVFYDPKGNSIENSTDLCVPEPTETTSRSSGSVTTVRRDGDADSKSVTTALAVSFAILASVEAGIIVLFCIKFRRDRKQNQKKEEGAEENDGNANENLLLHGNEGHLRERDRQENSPITSSTRRRAPVNARLAASPPSRYSQGEQGGRQNQTSSASPGPLLVENPSDTEFSLCSKNTGSFSSSSQISAELESDISA